MATDGRQPFFRNVDAVVSVNVVRMQTDLYRFLNAPRIPVLVLRYAMYLIPIRRMIGVPCMFRDRGIVSATEPDVPAVFNHSFTNRSASFANVDLVTSPARDLVNNAVASVGERGVLRVDEPVSDGSVGSQSS